VCEDKRVTLTKHMTLNGHTIVEMIRTSKVGRKGFGKVAGMSLPVVLLSRSETVEFSDCLPSEVRPSIRLLLTSRCIPPSTLQYDAEEILPQAYGRAYLTCCERKMETEAHEAPMLSFARASRTCYVVLIQNSSVIYNPMSPRGRTTSPLTFLCHFSSAPTP